MPDCYKSQKHEKTLALNNSNTLFSQARAYWHSAHSNDTLGPSKTHSKAHVAIEATHAADSAHAPSTSNGNGEREQCTVKHTEQATAAHILNPPTHFFLHTSPTHTKRHRVVQLCARKNRNSPPRHENTRHTHGVYAHAKNSTTQQCCPSCMSPPCSTLVTITIYDTLIHSRSPKLSPRHSPRLPQAPAHAALGKANRSFCFSEGSLTLSASPTA